MRRRRFQPAETGISLFPFMAVLICTMGTLIVLLMVVVRQAKVRADTVSQQQVTQRRAVVVAREAELEQRRIERDDHQWRFETLQQSRDQTADQLAEERLKLAHIEDHARRLEDELKRLVKEDETLKQLNDEQQLDQQTSQAEADELKRDAENERARLAAARDEAERKPRSYAIIPYKGRHGTNRRPIYIECRADRVILQPEGIVFTEDDFFDASNPGNPLAACLRATRAYWTRVGGPGVGDDAYPLLIVRPGGAEFYLGCREAMKSWDDEFGYELISNDIQLAFPPTDPALVDLLSRTLADARQFQERLRIAKLSQIKANQRRPYLRATSSQGGFTVEGDGPGGGRGPSRGGDGPGSAGRGGANPAGRRPSGHGTGSFGAGDLAGGHPASPGNVAPHGGGGHPTGHAQHTAGGPQNGESGADSRWSGPGGASAAPGQPRPGHGGSYAASSQTQTNSGQFSPGHAAGDASGGGAAGGGAAGGGAAGGAGRPTPGNPQGGTSNGQPSRPGEMRSFADSSSQGTAGAAASEASLAETRGRDWAVPHAARGSTGVNRPIRVVCAADQLTIVPQRGASQSLKAIPMRGTTKDAVDQFISALWQHIEDWGIAGPGMYWKPELNVEVAPGGQTRFDQLKQLLEDSGIQVRQKMR